MNDDTIREAPAPAVAVAVSHIGVAARILAGTPPRQAFDASYGEYFELYIDLMIPVLPASAKADLGRTVGRTMFPQQTPPQNWDMDPHGGLAPRPRGMRWTTACFIRACEQNQVALGWDPDTYRRRTRQPGAPAVTLGDDLTARLRWMMNMMRIYASGGGNHQLTECARIALDHAAGRPRQHRAPASEDWLRSEIGTTLTRAREALSQVRR